MRHERLPYLTLLQLLRSKWTATISLSLHSSNKCMFSSNNLSLQDMECNPTIQGINSSRCSNNLKWLECMVNQACKWACHSNKMAIDGSYGPLSIFWRLEVSWKLCPSIDRMSSNVAVMPLWRGRCLVVKITSRYMEETNVNEWNQTIDCFMNNTSTKHLPLACPCRNNFRQNSCNEMLKPDSRLSAVAFF